jgi:hypothetical protein
MAIAGPSSVEAGAAKVRSVMSRPGRAKSAYPGAQPEGTATSAPTTSCVALAAACMLLASCASEPLAPSPAPHYRPAPRSTLASSRGPDFVVAHEQRGMAWTTVLARRQAGAPALPVARLLQRRTGAGLRVSVQRLPGPASADGRSHDVMQELEQLYALVLRQEPEARYCLGVGAQPCDAERDGRSHAQVLQALADARERASAGSPAAVPWRVVEMKAAPTRSWDVDIVGVRATTRLGPLVGVTIHFDRAPHSLCVARTGSDGVATCRLEDQHGDEHEHDHAAAVVATFPGDVRADRVLLPTTGVLTPAFAPRISTVTPGKP